MNIELPDIKAFVEMKIGEVDFQVQYMRGRRSAFEEVSARIEKAIRTNKTEEPKK